MDGGRTRCDDHKLWFPSAVGLVTGGDCVWRADGLSSPDRCRRAETNDVAPAGICPPRNSRLGLLHSQHGLDQRNLHFIVEPTSTHRASVERDYKCYLSRKTVQAMDSQVKRHCLSPSQAANAMGARLRTSGKWHSTRSVPWNKTFKHPR